MARWTDGPGGQAFFAICDAIECLDSASKAERGVADAFVLVGEAAVAGIKAPPIPDRTAQASWSQALSDLADFIGYFYDGSKTGSHDLEVRANASLREATRHLAEMGERFQAVGAALPSR